MLTPLLRVSFNAHFVARGGVTQARVNQGCAVHLAHMHGICSTVGAYISLSHIYRYLVIYGMWAGEQTGSPLTMVGCGMPHKFSPLLLWKSWQARGSLQLISAASLCTAAGSGTSLRCFGMPWSSHSPDNHIPPSTPGTAKRSAPPGLHLQGLALADKTFQSHLEELYWLFFAL